MLQTRRVEKTVGTDVGILDDPALILAYRNGDPTALIQLWTRYDRMVYGTAHSLLCQREAAEDIRQEVFLKVFTHLSALKEIDRFGSWLHTITRNTCQTWIRRRKRVVSDDELGEAEHPAAMAFATELEASEQRTWLRRAIDALPEDFRVAVDLHYFEEQPLRQISLYLGVTESTVKWRLFKARELLKRKVETLR